MHRVKSIIDKSGDRSAIEVEVFQARQPDFPIHFRMEIDTGAAVNLVSDAWVPTLKAAGYEISEVEPVTVGWLSSHAVAHAPDVTLRQSVSLRWKINNFDWNGGEYVEHTFYIFPGMDCQLF